MKTFWQGGDIITAEKLNNIEKNSQNNLFICLNDYQDEQDKTLLHLSMQQLEKFFSEEVFLYYYCDQIRKTFQGDTSEEPYELYTYIFQREFSQTESLTKPEQYKFCLFHMNTFNAHAPDELYFNQQLNGSVKISCSLDDELDSGVLL